MNPLLTRISNWNRPDEKFHSYYGFVTFEQWCQHLLKEFPEGEIKPHPLEGSDKIGFFREVPDHVADRFAKDEESDRARCKQD